MKSIIALFISLVFVLSISVSMFAEGNDTMNSSEEDICDDDEDFGDGVMAGNLSDKYLESFRLGGKGVISFKIIEHPKHIGGNNEICMNIYMSDNSMKSYQIPLKFGESFIGKEVIQISDILEKAKINEPEKIKRIVISQVDDGYCKIGYKSHSLITGSMWVQPNENLYYVKLGELVRRSTVIDGIRYQFDKNGVCHGKYTGWTKSTRGRRYYKDCVMITNKWIKTKSGQRYYAGADGYIHID